MLNWNDISRSPVPRSGVYVPAATQISATIPGAPAAMDTGVARRKIDIADYETKLRLIVGDISSL